MLSRLSVSNFAVVEKVEADFVSGLNVLTGETGAGKSVIIGALDLVLGSRSDVAQVRDGAREARVEAVFDLSGPTLDAVSGELSSMGLPACEDGQLLIRRTVSAAQAGKVWVNDSPATVAALRRIGSRLADIHGPRSNQRILEETFQRKTLDSYAGVVHDAYLSAWSRLSAARNSIKELEDDGARDDEIDILKYQVSELEDAGISEEDSDIAERHKAASNAGRILEVAEAATEDLGGDGGAADRLSAAASKIATLSKFLPAAADWAKEAEALTLGVQELSRTVADAVSDVPADPAELEALDVRLSVISRLKRKYLKSQDAPVEDLIVLLDAKRARLSALEGRDGELERLRNEEKALAALVEKEGAKLSAARRTAAAKLAKAVTRELADLGFLQARFSIDLEKKEPAADGCDRTTFMFGPNPGESARPLDEIASSGEMARVMLAIKSVLALHDAVDTLVFDEIDANIGGETGRVVGEKMSNVSRHRQVVAITHLPQSAVFADNHLIVSKTVSGGRTRTAIAKAEGEKRTDEIARMLGGEDGTPSVREHAKELLAMASASKCKPGRKK